MDDLNFKVSAQETDAVDFNGNNHLYDFLNDLFRVRNTEKYREDYSEQNLALFPMEGGLGAVQFVDEESKQSARLMADQLLLAYADGDANRIETDTTYFRLDDEMNGEEFPVRDVLWLVGQEDQFFRNISGFVLHQKVDMGRCLFHVLHVDETPNALYADQMQTEFHIHSIKIKE